MCDRSLLVPFRVACALSSVLLLGLLLARGVPPATPAAQSAAGSRVPLGGVHATTATVVLMNWARPQLAKSLVEHLVKHPRISEVIVSNGRPDTAIDVDHPDVRNVREVDDAVGLSRRFERCLDARSEYVIHVDDDIVPSFSAIDRLLDEMDANPKRIVGRWGRQLRWGMYAHCKGECPVVLTKLMIMERRMCAAFFEYEGLAEDMIPYGTPKWNGEDLFMSLVAAHEYGAQHTVIPELEVGEIETNDGISGNIKGVRPWSASWRAQFRKYFRHTAYRRWFLQEATRRVASQSRGGYSLPSGASEGNHNASRLCVVTTLFGKHDHLRTLASDQVWQADPRDQDVTFWVITDSHTAGSNGAQGDYFEQSPPWRPLVVAKPFEDDTRRSARWFKIGLDPLWDKCQATLYIDANVRLRRSPSQLLDEMPAHMDVGVAHHPFVQSAATERHWLCLLYPTDCAAFEAQERDAASHSSFNADRGPHFETSFLLRRHTPRMREFSRDWRDALMQRSHNRDQMSFSAQLHANDLEVPAHARRLTARGGCTSNQCVATETDGGSLGTRSITPRVYVFRGHNHDFDKWGCHTRTVVAGQGSALHSWHCAVYYVIKRWGWWLEALGPLAAEAAVIRGRGLALVPSDAIEVLVGLVFVVAYLCPWLWLHRVSRFVNERAATATMNECRFALRFGVAVYGILGLGLVAPLFGGALLHVMTIGLVVIPAVMLSTAYWCGFRGGNKRRIGCMAAWWLLQLVYFAFVPAAIIVYLLALRSVHKLAVSQS